ncbi:MAG: GGDEF domain-containing protein [Dehalococcoidia bacterium]
MNKPPTLSFLFPGAESDELGSVNTMPVMRVLRPAVFALWFIVTAAEAIALVTTGEIGNLYIALLFTGLFAVVHLQFWWEESEQGRRVARSVERARGKIYEDEATGLPNSRHFVYELRRQMMRSVRSGRGFSLVLTDLNGLAPKEAALALPMVAKALRHSVAEGDFVAHLEGPVFAAIVADDREQSAAEKADQMWRGIAAIVPADRAASVRPVVSSTGYQGELEVRDFLRRAQRDLVGARSMGAAAAPRAPQQPASLSAA